MPLVLGPDTHLPVLESDRILQLSARSFDAFVWELWGVLLNGACLVLLPERWGLSDISTKLVDSRISAIFLTSRLFDAMIDNIPEAMAGLRLVGFGGEAASPCHVAHAIQLLPGTILVNVYGPSENTTFSLSWVVRGPIDRHSPVPIGETRGCDEAWLLDPSDLSVIDDEGVGELFVAGRGLALGYTDPALTESRFLHVPKAGKRLFRTRDLVERDADGGFRFLGRLDRQVKHLGHWLDLNVLEAMFARHALASWVHVVYDAVFGQREVTVFYTTRHNVALKDHDLLALVPESSTRPGFIFLHIGEIPLNLNSKADIEALINLARDAYRKKDHGDIIEKMWSDILPAVKIDKHTNFFEAGGDSLSAMNLILATEKRFDISLPSDFLLNCPRLEPDPKLS